MVSYCLQVTLKARLKRSASGLSPRAVLEKFAAVQLLDAHLPPPMAAKSCSPATPSPRKTSKSSSTNFNSPFPS
jgi:hypothetical protein